MTTTASKVKTTASRAKIEDLLSSFYIIIRLEQNSDKNRFEIRAVGRNPVSNKTTSRVIAHSENDESLLGWARSVGVESISIGDTFWDQSQNPWELQVEYPVEPELVKKYIPVVWLYSVDEGHKYVKF